jgi:hypothetical protein
VGADAEGHVRIRVARHVEPVTGRIDLLVAVGAGKGCARMKWTSYGGRLRTGAESGQGAGGGAASTTSLRFLSSRVYM